MLAIELREPRVVGQSEPDRRRRRRASGLEGVANQPGQRGCGHERRTGDLADVCGALPVALKDLGQDVMVVSPAYRQVFKTGAAIQPTNVVFEIPIGSKTVSGRLLESRLPGTAVPLYLVDQPGYYDRPELYREEGEDYKDNCERFIFFNRAVLELIRLLGIAS